MQLGCAKCHLEAVMAGSSRCQSCYDGLRAEYEQSELALVERELADERGRVAAAEAELERQRLEEEERLRLEQERQAAELAAGEGGEGGLLEDDPADELERELEDALGDDDGDASDTPTVG